MFRWGMFAVMAAAAVAVAGAPGMAAAPARAVSLPGTASAASSWMFQPVPPPAGTDYSYLSGISCSSPDSCVAAGTADTASGVPIPMVESWHGSTWALQDIPVPAGSAGVYPGAASCTSADSCTVVGGYDNAAADDNTEPLAEYWNGSTWAIQATPEPKITGTGYAVLGAVSCVSAASCMAVGSYQSNQGPNEGDQLLAEHWNGSTWTIEKARGPAGEPDSVFYGVSCVSGTDCTAVGYAASSATVGPSITLAEHWNGSTWAIQPTPNAAASLNTLAAVSCAAKSHCMAVGYTGLGTTTALAESWNGHTWAVRAVPVRAGAAISELDGVSCARGAGCTAVGVFGSIDTGTGSHALAERWSGSAWAQQATARYAEHKTLRAVSCRAARVCTAVGDNTHQKGTALSAVAEHENG